MDKKKAKIKVTNNGPYLVTGGIPLSDYEIVVNEEGESIKWAKGKDYEVPDTYALCRCGKSKNMPFCDGSHHSFDFDGKETARRGKYVEMAERIEGPEFDLLDQKDLCSEARFCAAGKTTWHLVDEDNKEPEKSTFLQQCADCPSGRYTAVRKPSSVIPGRKPGISSEDLIEPEFEPSIAIVHDPACSVEGPIWVRGGIEIEAEDGYVYEVRNRVTLCHCGQSKNKPFCDGSHIEI